MADEQECQGNRGIGRGWIEGHDGWGDWCLGLSGAIGSWNYWCNGYIGSLKDILGNGVMDQWGWWIVRNAETMVKQNCHMGKSEEILMQLMYWNVDGCDQNRWGNGGMGRCHRWIGIIGWGKHTWGLQRAKDSQNSWCNGCTGRTMVAGDWEWWGNG